jgi:hypothetical protein
LPDNKTPFHLVSWLTAIDTRVDARDKVWIINMMSGLLSADVLVFVREMMGLESLHDGFAEFG